MEKRCAVFDKKRIPWIDWSKVIAIYFVVLGHFVTKSNTTNIIFVHWIYSFHMPFFFFISGYLFRIKEKRFVDLLKRVFHSLIIPYIGLNLLANIFLIPTWILSGQGWNDQLFYFLTADGRGQPGPTWFLIALSWVWMMSWMVIKFKKSVQYIILVLSIIFAYSFPFHPWLRADVAITALPFFMTGYYLRSRNLLIQFNQGGGCFIIFFTLSIIGVYFNNGVNIYSREFGSFPLLYYPLAFIGIGQLIAFSMLLNKLRFKVIEILSTGTIAIMGLHGVENLYFTTLVRRMFLVDIQAYMGIPIVYVIECLIIMAISYFVIILLSKWTPWVIGNRKLSV